jgi:protein gp37
MENSKIQWTDHTINFWWGCTKVSEACQNCNAETVAKIFGPRLFNTVPEWGSGKPRFARLDAAQKEAQTHQRRALKARLKAREEGKPAPRTLIFVNSMSDWLDDEVPVHWLATLLQTLATCPDLTFQLLTKRPQNFRPRLEAVIRESLTHAAQDWPHGGADVANFWLANSPPKNVWIGTTVEAQKNADARIPELLKIPAYVRFLSCEPLLGRISLLTRADHSRMGALYAEDTLATSSTINFEPRIHWVIAGGESGGQARASHPTWFYDLRDQCIAGGVPFFFKQWGEWLPSGDEANHLPDTKTFKPDRFRDGLILLRTGVRLAGRRLEGREWNEIPTQP